MRPGALRTAQKPGVSERLRARPRRTESTREGGKRGEPPGASGSPWGRGVAWRRGEAARGLKGAPRALGLAAPRAAPCESGSKDLRGRARDAA